MWTPGSWVPGFLDSWILEFLGPCICGFVGSRILGFLNCWICGFLDENSGDSDRDYHRLMDQKSSAWIPKSTHSPPESHKFTDPQVKDPFNQRTEKRIPACLDLWIPACLESWMHLFLDSWVPGF